MLTQAALEAAVAQHQQEAGANPSRARQALLAGPIEVEGITLHPPTLGQILLLEEIGHPMFRAVSDGAEQTPSMTVRDMARLIYIYACPLEADAALRRGREAFEAECFRWASTSLPLSRFPAIIAAIQQLQAASTSTIPADGEKKTTP